MSDELTIDEVIKKYKGFWVAVNVTRRDEFGQPTQCRVLYADVDR